MNQNILKLNTKYVTSSGDIVVFDRYDIDDRNNECWITKDSEKFFLTDEGVFNNSYVKIVGEFNPEKIDIGSTVVFNNLSHPSRHGFIYNVDNPGKDSFFSKLEVSNEKEKGSFYKKYFLNIIPFKNTKNTKNTKNSKVKILEVTVEDIIRNMIDNQHPTISDIINSTDEQELTLVWTQKIKIKSKEAKEVLKRLL